MEGITTEPLMKCHQQESAQGSPVEGDMGLQEGPRQGFSVSCLFLLPCLHSPPGKSCFFSLESLFLGLLLERSGARLGLGLAAGCWLVGASGSCICLFSGVTGVGVLAEVGRQRLETLRPHASRLKLARAPLTPEGESGNVGNLGTVFGSSVVFLTLARQLAGYQVPPSPASL